MVMLVSGVIFMVAIAFWWYRAVVDKKRKLVQLASRNVRNSYHCVDIRSGAGACETVQHLAGTRFLSNEAPTLPVPGCTAPKCTCSFVHHDDRRQSDRRNPYGMWASIPPVITGERRSRTDRRKSHKNTFRPSIAR
jgi:hypothetical protein